MLLTSVILDQFQDKPTKSRKGKLLKNCCTTFTNSIILLATNTPPPPLHLNNHAHSETLTAFALLDAPHRSAAHVHVHLHVRIESEAAIALGTQCVRVALHSPALAMSFVPGSIPTTAGIRKRASFGACGTFRMDPRRCCDSKTQAKYAQKLSSFALHKLIAYRAICISFLFFFCDTFTHTRW